MGLAEPERMSAEPRYEEVSICQADLGLAEPFSRLREMQIVKVSICQADLGLAERCIAGLAMPLPAKFQSARQIWVWPNDRE